MTHLTSDELIDAMEGMLAADRQTHLAACDACQRELAGLSSALSEAKQVSVPEPSPFFWTHFSERVRVAIDTDSASGSGWPSWLGWQMLLPMGAAALIILALMMSVPKQDREIAPLALDESSEPAGTPDDQWIVLADLVGNLDFETATAAGVAVTPGVAELAMLELTVEEQQELTRLLRVELMRAKS